MNKEIKYTLLSVPGMFLLLIIAITLLSVMLDGGRCSEFAAFSYPRECGFGELIFTSFGNASLLSIYFFPVYIVIPAITFFITRHFRIKRQAMSAAQSNIPPQQQKLGIMGAVWIVVTVVALFALYLWQGAMGLSFFGLFPKLIGDLTNRHQVVSAPPGQKSTTPTSFQTLTQSRPENQIQQAGQTVGWKIYESNYGFKFKYPEDFTMKVNSSKDISFQKNSNTLFTVFILDNPNNLNAQGLKTEIDNQAGEGYPYQESFISISGVDSFKQGRYDDGVQEFYFVPLGNKTFNLNFKFGVGAGTSLNNQNIQLIKQILATFKII